MCEHMFWRKRSSNGSKLHKIKQLQQKSIMFLSTHWRVILAEIIDILLHWHRLGQLTPNFPCLKPDDRNRQYPVITQGHSKKLASTEKNKNMLKLIISTCDICDNDIAHFPLPVTKIAWKTTFLCTACRELYFQTIQEGSLEFIFVYAHEYICLLSFGTSCAFSTWGYKNSWGTPWSTAGIPAQSGFRGDGKFDCALFTTRCG